MGITVAEGISLAVNLLQQAMQISQLVQQAQAAGQTNLDTAAWAQIKGNDASAMTALAKEAGIAV